MTTKKQKSKKNPQEDQEFIPSLENVRKIQKLMGNGNKRAKNIGFKSILRAVAKDAPKKKKK